MTPVSSMFYKSFLWALTAFNSICAFLYLLDTVSIMRQPRQCRRPCAFGSHTGLGVTPFLLPFFSAYFGCVPIHWKSFILCIGFWLFNVICAILQKKLTSFDTWREYLEDIVNSFFHFFIGIRDFLLWLETVPKRLGKKGFPLFIGLCATWIFFTCLYGAYKIFNLRFILILTIPFVLLTWFYSACVALHSCARLLAFWLVHGFFFAITIVAIEETISKSSAQSVTAYCLFVLAFSSLWIMEAGAADDDVAKMAALIINTVTTILLIVINVLSGWGLSELSQFPKLVKLLGRLQYYSVVILLPLVVAGYLSALLKEVQIYWKNHTPHES